MIIFLYTFFVIFIALVVMLGVGSIVTESGEETSKVREGKATAAMCTTRLLESYDKGEFFDEKDFVIEQDLVYTYDSINL